jgi:hypothetical protein
MDDKILLFNSRFKFSGGKLKSQWGGMKVIEEVYRSGAIRLHGDIRGKSLVNEKHLKHYIAGQKNRETSGRVPSPKFREGDRKEIQPARNSKINKM